MTVRKIRGKSISTHQCGHGLCLVKLLVQSTAMAKLDGNQALDAGAGLREGRWTGAWRS